MTITVTWPSLEAACVMRSLRIRREILVADMEASTPKSASPAEYRREEQALSLLQAELLLLDGAIQALWEQLAAYTVRETRRMPP